MPELTNVLIVGGGSIGQRHAKNILARGGYTVALVEPNTDRAGLISQELKIPVFASIESAYQAGAWGIAFVCSPTAFHLANAVELAGHGAHLFIEKPLAHTTDGLDDLAALCTSKNLITLVGSNWKFYPLFVKMKEWLSAGTIGRVLSARCEFGQYLPDWHPWEDYRLGYSANKNLGGGILFDSHEIDYLTWFMDNAVAEVACLSATVSNLEIDVEDVAEVLLRFKNGSLGAIHMDYVQRFYRRTFEFFGSNGTISWDVTAKKAILQAVNKDPEIFVLPEPYDLNDMYRAELEHFISCVKNNTPTITPLGRGQEVVKLIMAAKQSAAEKRTIIL